MAAKDPALPPGGDLPPRKRSRLKLYVVIGSILLVFGTAGGATYWLFFREAKFADIIGMIGIGTSASTPADAGTAPPPGTDPSPQAASGKATASGGKDGPADSAGATNRSVPRPVPLPDLTVNLADSGGNRYLKIGMEVELNAPESAQELAAQNARVRDAIILLLSSKTVAQLSTSEGKVLLKNEVAARLNQILGAPRVVRIFFTNFVFQ